jgi:hypothetical protein
MAELTAFTLQKMAQLMNWFENRPTLPQKDQIGLELTNVAIRFTNKTYSIDEYLDVDGLLKYTDEFFDRYIKDIESDCRPLARLGFTGPNLLFERLMSSLDDLSDSSYKNIIRTWYLAGAIKFLRGNLMDLLGNSDMRNFIMEFTKFVTNPPHIVEKVELRKGLSLIRVPV